MNLVFYSALTFTVFLVFALIFAPVILRPSPAARRMLEMVRQYGREKLEATGKFVALRLFNGGKSSSPSW